MVHLSTYNINLIKIYEYLAFLTEVSKKAYQSNNIQFGLTLLQEIEKFIHNLRKINLIFELGRGMYLDPKPDLGKSLETEQKIKLASIEGN